MTLIHWLVIQTLPAGLNFPPKDFQIEYFGLIPTIQVNRDA